MGFFQPRSPRRIRQYFNVALAIEVAVPRCCRLGWEQDCRSATETPVMSVAVGGREAFRSLSQFFPKPRFPIRHRRPPSSNSDEWFVARATAALLDPTTPRTALRRRPCVPGPCLVPHRFRPSYSGLVRRVYGRATAGRRARHGAHQQQTTASTPRIALPSHRQPPRPPRRRSGHRLKSRTPR